MNVNSWMLFRRIEAARTQYQKKKAVQLFAGIMDLAGRPELSDHFLLLGHVDFEAALLTSGNIPVTDEGDSKVFGPCA